MGRALLSFALMVVLCGALAGSADDLFGKNVGYVTVEPIETVTIVPGQPTPLELHFRIGNGSHINSNRPGSDLLIPTTVKLMPPTDIAAGRVTYPRGKDLTFPFSPEDKLNVYTEAFTVKGLLTATRTALPGRFTVHGQLHYQACNDNSCFPPKTLPLQFDVKVERASAGSTAGSTARRGQSPHIRR